MQRWSWPRNIQSVWLIPWSWSMHGDLKCLEWKGWGWGEHCRIWVVNALILLSIRVIYENRVIITCWSVFNSPCSWNVMSRHSSCWIILKTQNVGTFIKNYTVTISLKLVKFAHCNCTIHIHHRINKNTWTLHIIGKSTYIIGYKF